MILLTIYFKSFDVSFFSMVYNIKFTTSTLVISITARLSNFNLSSLSLNKTQFKNRYTCIHWLS